MQNSQPRSTSLPKRINSPLPEIQGEVPPKLS